MSDPEVANNVSPDEIHYIFMFDISVGLGFHLFIDINSGDKDEHFLRRSDKQSI